MDDFYITLISNSSTKMFPENSTASFTVLLPQKICLKGEWCVGIAEMHYNYNFFNVCDGNNKIIFDKIDINSENRSFHVDDTENGIEKTSSDSDSIPLKRLEETVHNGFYKSVQSLIDAVNEKMQKNIGINLLSIDKFNNRTKVEQEKLEEKKNFVKIDGIYFENRLAMQLGFEPNKNVLEHELSPHVGNIYYGIPDQMLIYTDVIEPVFIGHEKAHVLKIINTTSAVSDFGDSCYKEFHHIHYVRLQKKEFEHISIDIRDYTGKRMPFLHGVSSLKLHFKKN